MWMAYYTDAIITINREDYKAAQKLKLRNGGKVYYLPGVGVDTSAIKKAEPKREEILRELGINSNSILMISVGELNKNKNNKVIISALGKIQNSNIHYLLCGVGDNEDYLKFVAKSKGVEKNVHFLGYRTDIAQLLKSCDIFVITSYREGLPRSMMEAMSAGLPCIASKIRGNVDLIEDGKGGFLCNPDNVDALAEAIKLFANDEALRKSMGINNLEVIKKFDVENVKKEMEKIYEDVLLKEKTKQ